MLAREVSSPVFGIGVQEMVIVGVLFLVIFGPSKLPDMARDVGRFVSEARRSVVEFKEDLVKEDLVSEADGGREPSKGRSTKTSREIEESAGREKAAVVARSLPPNE